MVIGYVKSLLECRRDRSVFIEGNPRVYQNTSQFANETAVSTSCGPVMAVRKFKASYRGPQSRKPYQGDRTRVIFSRYGGRVRLR